MRSLILALIFSSVAFGQLAQLRHAPGAPTNTACTDTQMYKNDTTGDMYNCQGGTLTQITTGGAVGISGSGTANTVPLFTAATVLGNSTMTYDGTNFLLGINKGFEFTATASSPVIVSNSQSAFNVSTGSATGNMKFELGQLNLSGPGSGTQNGRLVLEGSTSGFGAIGVAAIAGTPADINLPTATGASGQVLQTDGANPQQLSWSDSTITVTQDGGGCTNCEIGPDLTVKGGFIGGIYNTTASSIAALGYFSKTRTGSKFPFGSTMYFRYPGVCLAATALAYNVTRLGFRKLNQAGTLYYTSPYNAFVRGSDTACQVETTGQPFYVAQSEFTDAAVNSIASVSVRGWSAEVIGTAIQPVGAQYAASVAGAATVFSSIGQGDILASLTLTDEEQTAMPLPVSATARNLCVTTSGAQPATGSLVVTVRESGVDTTVAVTIPLSGPAGVYCSATSEAMDQGDYITWSLANAAATASAVIQSVTLELISLGSSSTTILFFPKGNLVLTASATRYLQAFAMSNTIFTTETDATVPAPRDFGATTIACFVKTAPANTLNWTLYIDGAGTALTLPITSGFGAPGVASNSGAALAVQGDSLSLEVITGAGAQAVISGCAVGVT